MALGWLALFAAASALVQLAMPNFFDGDTGYHLAVARLTREHGILHAFPWTSFSWLSENYADKELLFHLLLVPVAGLDPNVASRIAGTLLGTALLGVLYGLLRAENVARPGVWALALLTCSSAFVWRFALVRPHLIAIPLAMLLLWAALRRRWIALAAIGALYPLCYTAWHLPLVLAGIAEVARLASSRAVDARPGLLVAAAVALGVAIHPNFPQNLGLFWIQNVEVLFQTAWSGLPGFELGGEFRPFSPLGMLRYVLVPGLMAGVAVPLAWRQRERDALPLAVVLTALAFGALTLRTQRFIEYLAPFAVLSIALALRERERAHPAAAVAALVGLLWMGALGRHPFERMLRRDVLFPPPVAELLDRVVPVGAQVFTCDWHFTGEMMLALPERRFMVALDPVFFARHDLDAYQTWFELVRRPPEGPARVIRETFDARYVLCDARERWRPLESALRADSAALPRARAGLWWVYEILPEVGVRASTRRAP